MTFTTKHRTGFEIGSFTLNDSGAVTVASPTLNSNPSTKLYTDTKVNDAVTQLSTVTTTLTGDISGQGITTIPTTLSLTGVSSGTYSRVEVDTKGRVISGSNFVFNSGTVQGSVIANQVVLNLQNNGITPGLYQNVVVDATGRITSGSSLSATNITTSLGYVPVNRAGDTLTGRLTLSLLPTNPSHLVNKTYSDRQFYVALALGY